MGICRSDTPIRADGTHRSQLEFTVSSRREPREVAIWCWRFGRRAVTLVTGASAASGRPSWEVALRRVLLLNITYEPLTTVGLHRAVGLVLAEKAEIVHDEISGLVLHSASVKLAVPSVIRLRRYVRIPHRNRVPLTRAALMRRDNYLCAYCGSAADTIDHVVPRSRGGAHVWENCVASCTRCNHRKADRLIDEIGWKLRWDPLAPRGMHWRLIGAARDGDPQWATYLAATTAA
jgi:5-methylcytosine-specific restriction endonuclease McrA